MRDSRLSTIWRADYCYDVKTERLIDALRLHIVVDGYPEVAQFGVIDGLDGIAEDAVAARLHFNEHHRVAVYGYDVDVAMP